jgi:transcriptional regulator with XRE-family HTH domain
MPAFKFSGSKLRAARTGAGLTREQLGESVDHGKSAITLYELGYRTPPLEVLVGLADILAVHVEELFEVVDEVPA